MIIDPESNYSPEGKSTALLVSNLDSKALRYLIDQLRGRAGFQPVMRGESLIMHPRVETDFPDLHVVDAILRAAKRQCRDLVWRNIVYEPVETDSPVDDADVMQALVPTPGTSTVYRAPRGYTPTGYPLPLDPEDFDNDDVILPENVDKFLAGEERPTVDGLPDELVNLERGKFVVLDGKTLVVNVEGFSDDTIENLRNSLLILEIPGVEGGVNDRSVLILPTIIGNLFYFEFNELVDPADSELIKNIASIVETELVLFEAWQKA